MVPMDRRNGPQLSERADHDVDVRVLKQKLNRDRKAEQGSDIRRNTQQHQGTHADNDLYRLIVGTNANHQGNVATPTKMDSSLTTVRNVPHPITVIEVPIRFVRRDVFATVETKMATARRKNSQAGDSCESARIARPMNTRKNEGA